MINWNVSFDSFSQDELDSTFQGGSSTLRDLLTNDVELAGKEWSKYFNGPPLGFNATVDVQIVSIASNNLNDTTWVKPIWGLDFVPTDLDVINPFATTESKQPAVAAEINTGVDFNTPLRPDVIIYVNPDFLKNDLWMQTQTAPQRYRQTRQTS